MNKNDEQAQDWNPISDDVLSDQRSAYDEMRSKCPVAHSNFLGRSLFNHNDITAVLEDSETYSNASAFLTIPNGMDPPIHSQFREALNPSFDKKQIVKLEPNIRRIATNLLDPLISNKKTDFIKTFASPFVFKSLCVQLGWPEEQWEYLDSWTHGNQQVAFSKDAATGKLLADQFSEYVRENLDVARNSSGTTENATKALLNTEVEGALLNDEQIVSLLRNWVAGHGTVAAGLGILVAYLAQDQELQDRLRNKQSLIPRAIEEILRTDGPLVTNPRTVTKDIKIQGQAISKGERITLMWIAANRDPQIFDDPNTVKIERNTDDSLVWGKGIHLCQGMSLARLEMCVALEELLSRTKSFENSGKDSSRMVFPVNGFNELFLILS